MSWNSVLDEALSLGLTILSLMIPMVLPPLLYKLLDKLGADADASRREAFVQAMTNGLIGFLASRGYKKGDALPPAIAIDAARAAAEYAAKTVPSTIRKLGIEKDNLAEIASKQLPQVMGSFSPAAPPAAVIVAEPTKEVR